MTRPATAATASGTTGSPSGADHARGTCDQATAVTRSLLGYGVLAGPLYVLVGLAQAVTRDGFDLRRHELSLLANGPFGWIQMTNLVLSGLMTVAAAAGIGRAVRRATALDAGAPRSAGWAPRLITGYGLGLIVAGFFRADPMDGFPLGTPAGTNHISSHGTVHLVSSGIGFFCLIAACFVLARRFAAMAEPRWATYSRIAGVVTLVGFVGGAALAASTTGVGGLWIAVLSGWSWLALTCAHLYNRSIPTA